MLWSDRATDNDFIKFVYHGGCSLQRRVQRRRRHATPHLHKGPQGEHWRVYKYFGDTNKTVEGLSTRNRHIILQEDGTHANNRKSLQRLAQGEPAGGVREGGLASQPAQLQPFRLFCVGRLWVIGQCIASQQNRGPDPKDEDGDGLPWQGHRGKGLLEVHV